MSLHTTMLSSSQSSSRHPGFLRKLAGCVLFVSGIAGFMALINVYQVNLSPFLMMVFAVLAVGLAAGAVPRASFYEWSVLIRFLVALITLPLGLYTLGFFTNWQMGIGPLEPWLDGVVDPYQLAQLCGAFLVAVIALEAWRKPVAKSGNTESQHPRGRRQPDIPPVMGSAGIPRSLNTLISESVKSPPKTGSFLKFMKIPKLHRRMESGSGNGRLVLPQTPRNTYSGLRRLFKRKPSVHVSLYEVHRCPFCLEEVRHHDPRGVKKCEVCNTLHHADCWEITGACQVPHLNT